MKTIGKLHRRFLLGGILCLLMVFAFVLAFTSNVNKVFAETVTQKEETVLNESKINDEVSPRGLYTHLSLSINGGDGKIWATVRNDFTLFPANVTVIVELYSSDTYYESHTNMTLVSMRSIEDLNMGNSIVAEGYTGGVQKYWQGRMRYKIDNGGWKSEITGTLLYSADGTYLGLQ